MKKCVIVSDSFKGTLSSTEICSIAEDAIPRFFSDCEVVSIPVADGGEGTVEAMLRALKAESVSVTVHGAYMQSITAIYARCGDLAVIEMAAAAGLPSVGNNKNPALTTTYGVGELIRDAVKNGCKRIYLGLGGSATNDGGCGCAAALGVEFRDCDKKEFIPVGTTLGNIASIDISKARELLNDCKIIVMSDVKNELCGEFGAAHVFGPQKGADEAMVTMLDTGLEHMSAVIQKDLGVDVLHMPCGGAAGGMGAGTVAFLGAEICSGIDAVLDITDFNRHLEDADLVITGEGRLDTQSLNGKVISGVAKRCTRVGVPLIAIVGTLAQELEDPCKHGLSAVFTTNRANLPFSQIPARATEDYRAVFADVMRLIKISKEMGVPEDLCFVSTGKDANP